MTIVESKWCAGSLHYICMWTYNISHMKFIRAVLLGSFWLQSNKFIRLLIRFLQSAHAHQTVTRALCFNRCKSTCMENAFKEVYKTREVHIIHIIHVYYIYIVSVWSNRKWTAHTTYPNLAKINIISTCTTSLAKYSTITDHC